MRAQKLSRRRVLAQVTRRLFPRQRTTVWTMRGQGVVDVSDSDDLGEQRDLVAAKSKRIAAAVQSFVMKPNDGPHGAQ